MRPNSMLSRDRRISSISTIQPAFDLAGELFLGRRRQHPIDTQINKIFAAGTTIGSHAMPNPWPFRDLERQGELAALGLIHALTCISQPQACDFSDLHMPRLTLGHRCCSQALMRSVSEYV